MNSFAPLPPPPPPMMFCFTTGLKTMEPDNLGLESGAKIDFSSFKLIFSVILSQQWKAD
jgi:hypothetical protein